MADTDEKVEENETLSESLLDESEENVSLQSIYGVPVTVTAVLGSTSMQVSQLLKLGKGNIIKLDQKVGSAIDILVNNRLVARGEIVIVEDRIGVTMTEIVKNDII